MNPLNLGGKADVAGVRLVVADTVFEGWITAEVERTLDEFVPRFSLRYLDRWAPDQKPWPIRKGTAARLLFDDELLIDGYVTRARFRVAGKEWQLSADGRAKTCDLADSSAVSKTGHWRNVTATAIVRDLIAPYKLTVKSSAIDTEIYPRFALEEGETVHAAIERVCKVRALMPTTSPDGNVLLYQAGAPGVQAIELEMNRAIERVLSEDEQDQHSEYLLSDTGVGTPEEAFAQAAIVDPNVARYRPLVVMGDAPSKTAQAKIRAQWECNVRAGRSERLEYTMAGALCASGDTYQPGQLFKVKDDILGVDEIMLCARAVLNVEAKSMTTRIELVRPEAYAALAYPRKKLTGTTKRGKPIVHKTPRI